MARKYQRLNKNNITVNPEPLIITAQEQTLNTKKVANKIYHTVQDLRCRLCTQHAETVAHIISDCIKLAGTKYAERHNNLALIVYRVICVAYNLEHRKDWWVRPEKFVRNDDTKMLRNSPIQTDKHLLHNWFDFMLINIKKQIRLIIDITVPRDENVQNK